MSNYKTITDFFNTRGPADVERFVDKNLDISQQVYALLADLGWSQKDFARKLGKTEAEISKWLSGSHNLTLRSIAKMEAALDKDIILTPLKAEKQYAKVDYRPSEVHAQPNESLPDQKGYRSVVMKSFKKPSPAKAMVS
jgi:transcriptional regulator with XRE-family HTH domain